MRLLLLVALVLFEGTAAAQSANRGVIRGRVTSATGAPLPRATITLRVADGRESRTFTTDENGRYEIPDLAPGRYTLTAASTGHLTLSFGQRRPREAARPVQIEAGQTVSAIDFVLPPASVIVARVVNEFGEPLPGVRVEPQQSKFSGGQRTLERVPGGSPFLTWTDDRGETRLYGLPPGDYYVAADPATSPYARQYSTTYFPGTLSMGDAARIRVGMGEEVPATFSLVPASAAATISGVVLGLDGAPISPRSGIQLRQFSGGGVVSSRGVPVFDDGTFSMTNVAPGAYTLGARDTGDALIQYPLVVPVGGNVSGIVVRATRGGVMRGRIVFDPGADATNPQAVVLTVDDVDPLAPTASVKIDENGRFEAARLVGSRWVRLAKSSTGWFVKAVRHQGRDVTDVPFDFGYGATEIDGVEVVLAARGSEVLGAVVDGRGQSVTDYVVIVFPEARERWTAYSRSIGTGRADQSGSFRIRDLPAGEYRVIAVPYLEEGSERDPEVLGALWDRAERVTLGDAATATVSLRLVE